MESSTLNNGIQIPQLGSGTNTFGKENKDFMGTITNDTTELLSVILLGYRLLDTAVMYRNEGVVGKAIKESGIDREDFFITTKIPGDEKFAQNIDLIDESLNTSLELLQTDYIDLYLIHHPWDNLDEMVAVWKVLEKQVESGKIRSLGVSNFNKEQIDYLMQHTTIKPTVNQIESHPGKFNDEIVEYCKLIDILPQAWSPLKNTNQEIIDILDNIGKKYSKTWNQVLLRYQIQRGVNVIPKSHNPINQKSNMEIFDFTLSEEEMIEISKL